MAEIASALTSEQQAVVCADIRCAFASVNIDAAYDLPFLPRPLIRRAIDYRSHQFVRRERSDARDVALASSSNLEMPPSGLMEGSPVSNAIFSVFMDDLTDHVGECIRVFSYCDNIILIAPSMSQAQQAEAALVAYFTSHRAGPFEVVTSVQSICEPFDHLGYEMQWQNELEVRLSMTNWRRFMERLERGQIAEARTLLRTSFPACSASHRWCYDQVIAHEAAFRQNQRSD
jgi:hypothetical protein